MLRETRARMRMRRRVLGGRAVVVVLGSRISRPILWFVNSVPVMIEVRVGRG